MKGCACFSKTLKETCTHLLKGSFSQSTSGLTWKGFGVLSTSFQHFSFRQHFPRHSPRMNINQISACAQA